MDIILSPNRIFIACGYTDMRKSIDGLSGIVAQQFQLNVFDSVSFSSAGEGGIDSKPFSGEAMALFSCTNAWKAAGISGPIQMMLSAKSTLDNIVGCWKVLPLISPRQFPK